MPKPYRTVELTTSVIHSIWLTTQEEYALLDTIGVDLEGSGSRLFLVIKFSSFFFFFPTSRGFAARDDG